MEHTEPYEKVKFTAVEWLYLQLIKNPKTPWNDILEQAKEMEKEQIENAYSTGADDEYEHHINDSVKREDIDCEKYYNETYGK